MSRASIIDYYVKAFQKLENEGKDSWNWSAACFTSIWLFYRKMYLYAFLFTLFNIAVFVMFLATSVTTGNIALNILEGLGVIGTLLLGYFGNRLYYRTVRKKIERGYHLLDNYHPFSVSVIVVAIMLVCLQILLKNGTVLNAKASIILGNIINSVTIVVMVQCYAFADWLANYRHQRKRKDIQDTAFSEKNVCQYLIYSNENHFPGQIAAAFSVLLCIGLYETVPEHIRSVCKADKENALELESSAESEALLTSARGGEKHL